MIDSNFFKKSGALTVAQIAEISGARLADGANPDFVIEDVAPLNRAGAKDLSFLDNAKYTQDFTNTGAGACFVRPELVKLAPANVNLLISDSPYKGYALAAQKFYPAPMPEARISKSAHIDPAASLGKGCVVEEGAVIMAGAKIGDGTWIEANAVIRENVVIGAHCRIGAGACIRYSLIGDHVHIYTGARIGQDGFGFAIDHAEGHVKVPQLGRVIIEDHVEIGANTTIDRGTTSDTVIGQGTWIDNLVQIGHNAEIGKGCIIIAQVGISGSTIFEDYVIAAGQAGFSGHLRIGKGARIAAQAGVIKDVPAGEEHMGTPSQPGKQYLRQLALLKRLEKKDK